MHSLVLILRDARTRVRSLPNVFGVRAPQDEDEHRVVHSSRFQTAHLVLATRWRPGLALLLHQPPSEGGRSAESRSGARRNTREACHLASKTRVNALMTRHARRLARRLASHDAGRSPLGAPPWPASPAHSRASGNPAFLGPRFRGDERKEAYATPRSAFRFALEN